MTTADDYGPPHDYRADERAAKQAAARWTAQQKLAEQARRAKAIDWMTIQKWASIAASYYRERAHHAQLAAETAAHHATAAGQ